MACKGLPKQSAIRYRDSSASVLDKLVVFSRDLRDED